MSSACHDLESALHESRKRVSKEDVLELSAVWHETTDRVAKLLGNDDGHIAITSSEYDALARAIADSVPRIKLAQMIETWRLEPTDLRLRRLAEQAKVMAQRAGKGGISVVTQANGIRLPAVKWGGFWATFTHAMRNAVDHGLERPEDRVAGGKSEAGKLTLRTFIDRSELVVSIEDDGGGIDWQALERQAMARRLPHATRKDLEAVLCADGVTTKETVTEYSGRGVGVGALLALVRSMGGRLVIWSEPSKGTRFEARFPEAPARARAPRAAWAALVARRPDVVADAAQ